MAAEVITSATRAKYPLIDRYLAHLRSLEWSQEGINREIRELNNCSQAPTATEVIAVTAVFTPLAGPLVWILGAGMAADYATCSVSEQGYLHFVNTTIARY